MESSYFSSISILSLYLPFLCLTLFAGKSSGAVAPALYLFGGSSLDAGNNNFLQTRAKANFYPYGIDFPGGSTGRYTNGATSGDFVARFLGLPYPPAYLSLSERQRQTIITGINYASSAAGILPESGTALGDILSLDEQINYFESTVRNDLPKIFRTPGVLSYYLSRSVFVIAIGTNDYLNNYLQPHFYNRSKTNPPQQFANLLLDTLGQQLTTIYNLGGRKFVVYGIGALGCLPVILANVNPKPTTPCAENVNNLINIFNNGLASKLQQLTSSLKGSTFVSADAYTESYAQFQDPVKYGFSEGRTPCCAVGALGTCLPGQEPCTDRNNHLYYDGVHPVQLVNYQFARNCFSGSTVCTPINIRQLAFKL
ncbi:hypothetical protein MKW98_032578 [Papaver atlanticum]|uniref:GDSL esterase/lipase n=1 Tax=Papaver atlanticum TaxID=357466 RepID=A0AAD4SUQ0_9MAGN|nr:hypothetical protein MKW98_032578 [Papaver atlanticum]